MSAPLGDAAGTSDPDPPVGPEVTTWRFAERSDAPFLYDLAVALDPRFWRFSRHGTAPFKALEVVGEYEVIAIVELPDHTPCGFAGLVDLTGDGRCAQLDLLAAPTVAAADAFRHVVGEILDAVFANATVDHLYVERFDDDPDLLADVDCFRLEVEIPEFAFVGGRLAPRLTHGVTRDEYAAWRAGSA